MSVFNTTPNLVGEVALGLALRGFRLASTVARYDDGDFKARSGRKVQLTVPSALIARSRDLDDTTTAIVVDQLSESTYDVNLSTHAYSAVALSEGDITLRIEDAARQVLAPQADAVVDFVENAIAKVLEDIVPTAGIAFSATDPVKTFTALRRALRDKGLDVASATGLTAVVGGNVADALLDSGALDFQRTGDAAALRTGTLGTVRGFEDIESGRVDDDAIVAYPSAALSLAAMPPQVPQGAKFGTVVNKDGFSLRYLADYDAIHTVDRSLVSTFVGAAIAPAYRIERDYTANTAEAVEVEGGFVVKVDTSA